MEQRLKKILNLILYFGHEWVVTKIESDHRLKHVYIYIEYKSDYYEDPVSLEPAKLYDHCALTKKWYFGIMKTLQDIKDTLSIHKNRLFHDYPIKSMAIFGSYSRKEQNDSSDLDIIIEFSDKIGIRFVDLAEELEDIVGFRVDLVSKKGIKDKYLKSINSDLIYV